MNLARLIEVLEPVPSAADHLERHRAELIDVLTRHESREAADDEIERSIGALRNIHRELPALRQAQAGNVAVYLPINLPLYSFVLFAAIPSLVASSVTVRAPANTVAWHREVLASSGLQQRFPRVRLVDATRRQFLSDYVQRADTVIFTGRYENGEAVRLECPDALFIFEGSGPNPIVIGPRADLGESFDRLVAPRLFNSGQDCAGPDAYLVHTGCADDFVQRLRTMLDGLATGHYADPNVRVGPILNRGTLKFLAARLHEVRDDIVYGGRVDLDTAHVQPTIIDRPIERHDRMFEFFAPVFNVMRYSSTDELDRYFDRPDYTKRAMYVSVFGETVTPSLYRTSTVLVDQTILEVERGNDPYGGYGPQANYVARGGHLLEAKPILLSAAIAEHGSSVVRGRNA